MFSFPLQQKKLPLLLSIVQKRKSQWSYRYCNLRLHRTHVLKGGNTGLVGGATPIHDELILSTGRIKNNFHLDPSSGIDYSLTVLE